MHSSPRFRYRQLMHGGTKLRHFEEFPVSDWAFSYSILLDFQPDKSVGMFKASKKLQSMSPIISGVMRSKG